MKKFLLAVLSIIICLSVSGCSLLYHHELNALDGFDIGFSEALNDAFISSYNWDGTERTAELVIPEEYNGMPITALGGYFGRGVPSPFNICLTDAAAEKLFGKDYAQFHISNTDFEYIQVDEIEKLNLNLHISKNIEEIALMNLSGDFRNEVIKDGQKHIKLFIMLFTVTCDEENKVFYAKDGKLYYKEGDVLVSDIHYYDFDVESYLG